MKTMQAAVFCGGGRTSTRRVPVPAPAPQEVCVRLAGCGVCASNLPVWSGQPWFRYPLAPGSPGHEGWGEVVGVGDEVEDRTVGDWVAILSDHAYAEYDVAPAELSVRLPEPLRSRPLPLEPLGCAMNILRRSDIRAGERVAVVGVGFIGALLIQLAAHAGAEVIAFARRAYAREIACRFGAACALPFADVATATSDAMDITSGAGFSRVIEVVGEQEPLDLASAICAEGGRLIIAGYHQGGPRRIDMQQWNWRGLDVVNAHERNPQVIVNGLRDAARAVVDGVLNPFPLLTHRYGLDALDAAFRTLQQRPDGFMKATVTL